MLKLGRLSPLTSESSLLPPTYSDMTVIRGHTDILLVDIIEIVRYVGFEEVSLPALLAQDGDREMEQEGDQAVLDHSDQGPHGCSV